MAEYFVVITSFPEKMTAEKVCKILINENLTACCQIIEKATSIYVWKGKIEKATEYLCFFKTEKAKLKNLAERIKSLHPYEVPEVVALKASYIDKSYAKWISEVLK